MIHTKGLTKAYCVNGSTVTALDHVSLDIPKGQFAAIIGPSGSGKSTLMHLLGCLDTPSSGEYRLAGQDVSSLDGTSLARIRGEAIGFVFQGFQLLPQLTAVENVALPLLLLGMPQDARLRRAEALLRQVGLGQRLHHRPNQLSGGQQQRVAIARALARNPAVLLADEPTGNLDGEATADVLSLLQAMHQDGRTIVLITHDPSVAAHAQRQITISKGKIVSDSAHIPPLFVTN